MFMSESEARQTADGQNKDHAIPRFYWNSMPDAAATEKSDGVQKFKNVLYVEIIKPGIRGQSWNGKATDAHKARFAGALERFEAEDKTDELDGFPIKECSLFSPAEKDNLRVLKFVTVESLADAPDNALKGMGMRDMSNRAKRFIENLEGPAAAANRLKALEDKVEALAVQSEEDKATIKALRSENTKIKNKAVKEDA